MNAAAWGKVAVTVALSAIAGFGLVTALARFRDRVTRLDRYRRSGIEVSDD